MKNNKGFTLTELLITIAIIGILAAIAFPQYLQGEAARVSEAVSQLAAIDLAEEDYKLANDDYLVCPDTDQPGCLEDLMGSGHPEINDQRYFDYHVIVAVSPPTFCAIATRNATSDPGGYTGKTVCMDHTGAYSGTHLNGPKPDTDTTGTGCEAAGVLCYIP